MMTITMPNCKPNNKKFGSGPVAKRPGWQHPKTELLSRSHRGHDVLQVLKEIISLTKDLLNIPDDYFVAIVGGSSTGAMESLLWSLLGKNHTQIIRNCHFSNLWRRDAQDELKVQCEIIDLDQNKKCEANKLNPECDLIFCMSSTTSGTSGLNLSDIPDNRTGLSICDAASAVFCMDLDWQKLDATAFSWQKGIGSEAGFGTIVLSPAAINRLKTYKPTWGVPRLYRLADNYTVNFDIFAGLTINTPSILCLLEHLENLKWAKDIGGMTTLKRRVDDNYKILSKWIINQNNFRFAIDNPDVRTKHIVCLILNNQKLSIENQWTSYKKIVSLIEGNDIAYDFLGHPMATPNLRFWLGPTIESPDIEALLPWLDWSYQNLCQI